jgi:hypothetical protein
MPHPTARNQLRIKHMPFKEKAIVRHKLRPDWGAGRILVRTSDAVQIDFSAGGLKKLKTEIADQHLEAASADEAAALKPEKAKAVTKRAPKTVVAAKTAVAGKTAVATKSAVAPKTRMV